MNANEKLSLTGPLTAEQMLELPLPDGRHELIEGELRMMSPAGWRHGRIAMRIGMLLAQHVEAHDLGLTFAAETGFVIARNPDTVRAPDVAFVSNERVQSIDEAAQFFPLAPSLAVEVLSPSDALTDAQAKAREWLQAGAELVLLVIPENQQVHAMRPSGRIDVLDTGDPLDADDVVRGWRIGVSEFFPS